MHVILTVIGFTMVKMGFDLSDNLFEYQSGLLLDCVVPGLEGVGISLDLLEQLI